MKKSPDDSVLNASWIWTRQSSPFPNALVRFLKTFSAGKGRRHTLRISADSRYWVWINGNLAGFGPIRSWPKHWYFETHDITPWLTAGKNVIAVLVNHWKDGNFQYIPAEPGLCARITDEKKNTVCETGDDWMCSRAQAEREDVPRICVQEAFEEQYDARKEDDWRQADYRETRGWTKAVIVPDSHKRMSPRPIPFLGGESIRPVRLVGVEEVEPAQSVWNFNLKPCFAPEDHTSRFCFVKGFLTTLAHSARSQTVTLIRPHHHSAKFWLNGEVMPPVPDDADHDIVGQEVAFRRGWNRLVFPYPGYNDKMASSLPAGGAHLPAFVLSVRAHHPLRWACRGKEGDEGWAFAGPFPMDEDCVAAMRRQVDFPRVVQATAISPDATDGIAGRIPFASEAEWRGWAESPWFQPIRPAEADSFGSSAGDKVTRSLPAVDPAPLLSGNGAWRLDPPAKGHDIRMLVDFGKMLVGNVEFSIDAPEDAMLDFHFFEFIQVDGRINLANGMNSSFRYTCREGMQSFRSLQRRGFQYMYVTARNLGRPLFIYDLKVCISTYPQRRLGNFACSDEQLNRIWQVGADTLRWCAEDTYTDCPTYEQTHWVGDSRNEGLVDWIANGDPRLWHHCLLQAGRSLERSPIIESHVPSAWDNILPAFSFLWLRSVKEYYQWTGDKKGIGTLYPWLRRNIKGILKLRTEEGLFRLHAWSLFDWAAMDIPSDGIITHQNCLAVLGLNDAASLAAAFGKKEDARNWKKAAGSLARSINRHLWDEAHEAYLDCIHKDGSRSDVFSQQTQTAALISGVAGGARAIRCLQVVKNPPRAFVKAGGPFFMFFVLEVLAQENRGRDILDIIRRDWGFMLAEGASSFWELWTLSTGRLTRSHCHGWASAPTFYLSHAILGVKPDVKNPSLIEFAPCPGNLKWLRGSVPVAGGVINVHGQLKSGRWHYRVHVPGGLRIRNRAEGVDVVIIRKK
jgi:hypothetical protein